MDKHPTSPAADSLSVNKQQYPAHEPANPYITAATSDNTRRTYQAAIRKFHQWGGLLPTDKDVLIAYLTHHAASLNPRTLSVHLTAISQWHHTQLLDDPTAHPDVRKTLKGIHRTHGKPKQKAKALKLEHLARMITHLENQPASVKALRDKALLLIGFFGAFRRSELVDIHIEHITFEADGIIILLPKSKTDQEGEGLLRAIPRNQTIEACCPVKALKNWLDAAKITEGPVFRPITRWQQIQSKPLYVGAVNDVLKKIGQACGFDFTPELSSHSFRRGLSTSAAQENVDFQLIKQQGGWKNDDIVRGYIEEGRLLEDNAAYALFEKLEKHLSV